MKTASFKRVPLYDRLPEIHRLRDAEQEPPGQLAAYLGAIEEVFGGIHENIETLYHDLFIDTCSDWVVPYLGDLLGVSALKGAPRTLRADVADTIALRRRKGTIAAIERLVSNLTGWGAHCVELRERLAWTQHLNHQRPDDGGLAPYRDHQGLSNSAVRRGGTMPLCSPALLSLLGTAFDPAPRLPDFTIVANDVVHPNLPNLAIFLWRLASYQIPLCAPFFQASRKIAAPVGDEAAYAVCFDFHPLSTKSPSQERPVRLFNNGRYDASLEPPVLTSADQVPGPILTERLTTDEPDAAPDSYVSIQSYTDAANLPSSDAGLKLWIPKAAENLAIVPQRRTRGDCLCAWESGLSRTLRTYETVIDPEIGRVMFGVATKDEADALKAGFLASHTYGSPGPVGAHPISREAAPLVWPPGDPLGSAVKLLTVTKAGLSLKNALANLNTAAMPVVIEIADSEVHALDLSGVTGAAPDSAGKPVALRLAQSLVIRAASGQRPIIRLTGPLGFRPAIIQDADPQKQSALTAQHQRLTVRLEGLFLARAAASPVTDPLINRAAVGRLEILGCTLDPGGHLQRNGLRAPLFGPAITLAPDFGFSDPADLSRFAVSPLILLQKTITGGLALPETRHRLVLEHCIVDSGCGPAEDATAVFAITGSGTPATAWACPAEFNGVTVFGRVRAFELRGRGGIFSHPLEVRQNQHGCIKFSCFSGVGDRLPQNHGCLFATEARLVFTSAIFGHPAYAQLARSTDYRIRERGPGDDAMGAYGFLLEAHAWANLHTRLREFMPAGVVPLAIPVS